MKIYQVKILPTAQQDLIQIHEYIAFQLLYPQTAIKQVKRIDECISSLDFMPYRYKQYEGQPWKSRGLRQVPVDKYIIFYLVDEERLSVEIIRILYGAMHIEYELNDTYKSFYVSEELAKYGG